MSNPLYYLVGLLIASAYPLGIEPLSFAKRAVAPWAVLGAILIYAGLCGAVLGRPLRRPGLARELLRVLALVLYAELVFVFHLPFWVQEAGVEDPMATALLTLAPLLAFYGVLAWIYARVEPHSGGLRFAFRGFLGLSLCPIVLMLLVDETFQRVEALRRLQFVYPAASVLAALVGIAILMVFLPPLLRLILGARPMPPGPLRQRLEQMCARTGFRATELLVVPTGTSRMANAFVVGLGARWRYVFFTEAILEGMSPDDLDCVLVHEITHSQKRHILFYLVSALSFSMVSVLAQDALDLLGLPMPAIAGLMLTWSLLYWGVAFGFVSRRFETEADLVAARRVPGVEGGLAPYAAARRMASALESVARLNHVPVWAPTWRHFTIERRIAILLGAERDPAVGLAFERVCDRLRSAASGLFLASLLCGGILFGLQHGKAPENRALYAAWEAVDRGRENLLARRYEEARAELWRGIDGGADSAAVQIWLADCERALGREPEARRAEAQARKLGVTDPRLRIRLGEGTRNP